MRTRWQRLGTLTLILALWAGTVSAVEVSGSSDPLPRFRAVEPNVMGGQGYAPSMPAMVGAKDTGGRLAWGASYLWHAYLEAYLASGESQWLDKLVKEFDAALAVRDDAVGQADYRGRLRPTWGSGHYTEASYYAWGVHNGVITYPMARFVELVLSGKAPAAYRPRAEQYLREIEKTVQAFDEDWREGPGPGQGYYIFPDDMPGRVDLRGRKLPLNQQNALGLTLLVLADVTGKAAYREKAEGLAAYFYSVLKRFPNGSYVWSYWGDFPEQSEDAPQLLSEEEAARFPGEDISHAAINGRFAYEAFRRGVVFTEADMVGIARTVVLNIWEPTPEGHPAVRYTIAGGGALRRDDWLLTPARGWIHFAQFDPRVWRVAARTYAGAAKGSVLAALGAVGLDRWDAGADARRALLEENARKGIPEAQTVYVAIREPGDGEELSGARALEIEVAAPHGLDAFTLSLDGVELYAGPGLPERLVINEGELSDGRRLLRATARSGASTDEDLVAVWVRNVEIVSPHYARPVRGDVPVELRMRLPRAAVEEVRLWIDDEPLYSGAGLPEGLIIDSLVLADGFHKLRAEVRGVRGGVAKDEMNFRVENYWEVNDRLEPPRETWFGPIDRSLTSARSDGWRYETEAEAAFHGDRERMAPTGPEEYLIWESANLTEAAVTLYARRAAADAVELAVSADGVTWRPLPYEAAVAGRSAAGWYKLELLAQAPPELESGWFRLTVRSAAGEDGALQVGQVVLRGRNLPSRE